MIMKTIAYLAMCICSELVLPVKKHADRLMEGLALNVNMQLVK
jgi:hypothetical protein